MRHLDLFSGIGGFALAARWAGIETVAFCEIEEFPRKVLNKNFPGIPIHHDIRELDGKDYEGIDLITGGGILANHSVAPGSAKAKKMTATSGRKCCELLHKQDPLGSFVKTLVVTSPWASTKCSLTWKVKATPHGRLLFQLVPKTQTTDGTGFGLWPTPQASDNRRVISTYKCLRNTQYIQDLDTKSNGWINPNLSELLMGYPINWTDLNP